MLTLATAAAIGVFGLFLFTHNKADVDLWGNVGFVQHLPNSPGFHRTNTFSFTEPAYPWVNHEWLAEYLLHQTHRLAGNPGLLLLKAVLGFVLVGILYGAMRRNSRSTTVRVLFLAIIMSTLGYGFSTRPHLFTYILIAALLSALLRAPPHLLLLLVAAPLGCLWANLHGAFFIGEILLLLATACAMVGRATGRDASWRTPALLGAASFAYFLGTLLTPYGLGLWRFVSESAVILRPVLSEWAPFNPLTQFSIHVDFVALACITVVAMLRAYRRCTLFELVMLAVALVAAVAMRRNIPLFAIVAGLVGMRHVDKALGSQIEALVDKLPKRAIVILLLAMTAVSASFFVRANREAPLEIRVPRDQFPIEAVAFLDRNAIAANALVFFDWAEYCIWKLHPRCHVFLDGRFRSAYSEKAIRTYLNFIYAGNDPLAALTDYPTDLVFVHVNNPCTPLMRGLGGWALAYEDDMAAIFVKRAVHEALLGRLSTQSADLPTAPLDDRFP